MKHSQKSVPLPSIATLLLVLSTFTLGAQEAAYLRIAVLEPVPVNLSARSDLLGKSLEQNLSSSALAVPGVALVERNNVDALMKEVELQLSGILSGSAVLSGQQLEGADLLVVSSYQAEGDNLVLAVRAIRVSDGTIMAALGRTGKASDHVSLESQLGTEFAGALALAVQNARTTRETDQTALLESARKAALSGNMAQTASLARQYLQQDRNKAEALELLYTALSSGQQEAEPGELSAVLDRLIQADPQNAEWRYSRARFREEQSDKARAAEDWKEIFRLAPQDRDLVDAYAVFFTFSQADPSMTELALQSAIKNRWNAAITARLRGLHGVALVTAGESAKGIKTLEEARKGGEKSTWLHESLGLAYLQSGKPKDAAKSLEEAARIREASGVGFDRFWMEVLVESLEAANRKADAATWRNKAGL